MSKFNLPTFTLTLIVLLLPLTSNGQSLIKGKVTTEQGEPVPFCSITLHDTQNQNRIVAFTHSSANGFYELSTDKKGMFQIKYAALSFRTHKDTLLIDSDNTIKELNIILLSSPLELKEVVVQAAQPIKVKNDTIVFDAEFFAQGNEEVVEDLLKKIPGLNIDSEGNISVHGKEVEKVMVEGDDFFEKGYKVLTKNMPAEPIDKVELLQNYSNNRLLKGIEQSDRVALNLRLKEEAKRVWFGNVDVGYDVTLAPQYEVQSNLMNFGKKNKYYFIAGLNNIGRDATGDIAHLIRPFRYDEPASIGDDQHITSLMNTSFATPGFEQSRTNINNAELVSLNAIFNPNDKLKIKTLGFFDWDEVDFFRNSEADFTANGTNFINTEDLHFRNASKTSFGKLDITYDISATKMLEAVTKYNNGGKIGRSSLLFNGLSTIENIQTTDELFDQKVVFSNRFQKNKALLVTGRFIHQESPQDYAINRFLFQDLFPNNENANNVQQLNDHIMQFAGLESHFFHRKQNGGLFESQLGGQLRKDNFFTSFLLKEDDTVLNNDFDGYQNDVGYSTIDLYAKSKYRHEINNLALYGKIGFHQLFNRLVLAGSSEQQGYFFINPTFGIDWEINEKNVITSSYALNTTNAQILDVFNNFALSDFRTFEKGTGGFNQLNASTLLVSHRLGDWSDKFFANTIVLFQTNHDFFSTNTIVSPNFSLAEKILIQDRSLLNIISNIDTYLEVMSSNLKIDIGYASSTYKNIVNNSDLRTVISESYRYGFELRSGFRKGFNFHAGTKWTTNAISTQSVNNSFTDNLSFLDLLFTFSEHLDFQLQTERYFFGNLDENNTYYFLDLDLSYNITPNHWALSLTGKNLFNTNTFKTFAVNDLGNTITEYRLLPRFILLKAAFSF